MLDTTNVGGLVLPLRSEFQVLEPSGGFGQRIVWSVEVAVSRAEPLERLPERPAIKGIVTVGDLREYAEVRDGVRYELTNAYWLSLDDPQYLEAKSNTLQVVAMYDEWTRRQQVVARHAVGWPTIMFLAVLSAGLVVAWACRRRVKRNQLNTY